MKQREDIRTRILEEALSLVPFDGWSMPVMEEAARQAGYGPDMVRAVFPGGMPEVLGTFAAWLDRKMLEELKNYDPAALRVRDRIKTAVMTRFAFMQKNREAERLALRFWSSPGRQVRAARLVWRTADKIWDWAGDTAEDYNFYTKRGLLSGVIGATTLAWLNDDSGDLTRTEDFLTRRIENIMKLGGILGKIKRAPTQRV